MGQWKDVPYEVKEQIVEMLEDERGSLCSANKEMYNLYPSFAFKAVPIDFNNPDRFSTPSSAPPSIQVNM